MLTCQVLLKACRKNIQTVLHEFQCESCAAFRDEAEAQFRGGGNQRFAEAKEKYKNQRASILGCGGFYATDLGPDVPWHITGYYPVRRKLSDIVENL